MKPVSKLSPGDTIAIVAPAKAIEADHVNFAKTFLESNGFKVLVGKHCLGRDNYFSGTEAERISDFQWALDDPNIKAILCARGGYGSVQILDKLQWASMLRDPKWIIGFSDITYFHQHVQKLGFNSLHGSMPLNFSENSELALSTMLDAIMGKQYHIECPTHKSAKQGEAQGKLVGGNLSILHTLLGTDAQVNYTDKILFIEDLAEHLYAIDRMFHAFRKAGVLNTIRGLVVGGMTDMKDTTPPFGKNMEELILSHFEYRSIPICFDFPAGHISDNRALILGGDVTFSVGQNSTSLTFL